MTTFDPMIIPALVTAVVACVWDLRTRRIPNDVTFGSALIALAVATVIGGATGLVWALAGWGLGLLLFFPLFALRGMGAGDVKLLAAFGAWLGPGAIVWVALYSAIAGGVLAIAVALARGYLGRAFSNLRLLLTHWRVMGIRPVASISLETTNGPRLAYALPMLTGLVVALWLR
jgi:prepilin peptidase CpaA